MHPVRVGLLRQPEIAPSALQREIIVDLTDSEQLKKDMKSSEHIAYDHTTDRMTHEFREALLEVADALGVPMEIEEYQIYDLTHETMGRKRRHDFLRNDILAALDPTPSQCALMAKASEPTQRIAAGFTQRESLFEQGRMLSTAGKLPVFQAKSATRVALHRTFLFHVPLNEDERASADGDIRSAMANAVHYPYKTTTIDVGKNYFTHFWSPPE